MPSETTGGRWTTVATIVAFVAIVALYFLSASRFFHHVEDAVISYTYARNVANGYGFVPNIGGERVEGFSNPLWVALLAAGQLLGVESFASSRALGIAFAVAELAMAYRLFRDHLLDATRQSPVLALLAPAILACMPGFQMWNHMGLENPLYGFLLLSATWLHLHEVRDDRRLPWSGLPLFGLLLTRPEAPMYVVCILAHKIFHLIRTRRDPARRARTGQALGRIALWLVLIAVPFGGYVAWRLHYFGWPLPMPYYVKLGEKRSPSVFAILRGDDPGLQYLGGGIWTLRLLPLLALAILAPILRRRSPQRDACALLLAQCGAACFFAIYSGGDWMHGWRWLHVLMVLLAPLGAAGLLSLTDWLLLNVGERPASFLRAARGASVAILFAVVALWPAVAVTPTLAADPPTLGDDVHERLDHRRRFAAAFFLDSYSILDGDQGALTYFAPPGVRTFDDVGLNEVATAVHHRSVYTRWFLHEYFFEQHRPTFFGPRRSPTSVPKDYPEWSRDYTVLPAYVLSRTKRPVHGGWMRKDVFRVNELPEDMVSSEPVAFDCGVVLRGARALAKVVDEGAPVRVETYWQAPHPVKTGFDYFVELALIDAEGRATRKVTRPLLHQAYAVDDWAPEELLRDPEALAVSGAERAGEAHELWLTVALFRSPHAADRDMRTPYGRAPLPIEKLPPGLEACTPSGSLDAERGALRVAHVTVDQDAARREAVELEATIRDRSLADARAAVRELALVLGPAATRVSAAAAGLSARVQREELAVGEHLLSGGHDREAADHLLVARAEDVRSTTVDGLLATISARMQAAAATQLATATTRAQTCAAYRTLLDAVLVDPQNSHARRVAEGKRTECWSVLSQLDFGEADASDLVRPDNARRVFGVGQRAGLRVRWRNTPNLEGATLPLDVRAYRPDGTIGYRRTVEVGEDHGEATFAWPFDAKGHWRVEATLEGRTEASFGVDVEPPP
jgi:hypothetical protein